MAIKTIRSTYALDVQSVRALERIANRWGVSKSEALRRAIRSAAKNLSEAPSAIDALDKLQESLRLGPDEARAWADRARDERRVLSSRREKR